jgi:DNA invertase Pin-like site-specific DNA recombinase
MTQHAYSYVRFSSPAQALGDSLRRQVEKGRAYCAKHGLTLDESLRDEGLSGYHGAGYRGVR